MLNTQTEARMEPTAISMTPAPGERLQRFVGDTVCFNLKLTDERKPAKGWRARLRTNLGRGDTLNREIIEAHTRGVPSAGASWHDLPMKETGGGWSIELPLAEVGFFRAKAYLLDAQGWQHWPEGPDLGISVHPDAYRTGNTIYCAFTRLFGATKSAVNTRNELLESQVQQIEEHGYSIIPPSGKLRDLVKILPHIVHGLGCRILHLLPVFPTPTTYARMGRFGSPYAVLDLTGIDLALVEFDRRTTGVDQFRELTGAMHLLGGRVFLDIIINHTGWGSMLQENRPEWFVRDAGGVFVSPGAWGVTWEDLVELKHQNVGLWDDLADIFLTLCRRGVDGFRCDAGYMVPLPAWQYIIARVRQEFPNALFLLEGLGGSWEATEALLTDGGMQWAYSELFQNHTGIAIAGYLDHFLKQSRRVGLLVHYSETHDNARLAKTGHAWSRLRNRLCALTSVSGGFGFTCGVEWLATEKIDVHGSTGLAWGAPENLVDDLARLNQLLAEHPCFFDGAMLERLSPPDSPVYALFRKSAEGVDSVLVLVNNDLEKAQAVTWTLPSAPDWKVDLLGQEIPPIQPAKGGAQSITLPPGAAYCLAPTPAPLGLHGAAYSRARAQAAWAIQALCEDPALFEVGNYSWREMAALVEESPFRFLAAVHHLEAEDARTGLVAAVRRVLAGNPFPHVVRWSPLDQRRVTLIPPGHWLLLEDTAPFRASLRPANGGRIYHVESIAAGVGYIACVPPREGAFEATLAVERYTEHGTQVAAAVRFLPPVPPPFPMEFQYSNADDLILLTNGIGGMARLCVDLGRVMSKYDCVLGANLNPEFPVDRHIFAKRLRVWVNADGFISPLDARNLVSVMPGPPAVWRFIANAGDERTVEIDMRAEMVAGRNTTTFHFSRPTAGPGEGKPLPLDADVRITVRVDIEDRNFHSQTKRNGGADYHFSVHTHVLEPGTGFGFRPAQDRHLRVFSDSGVFHPEAEWCENIPHPIEQSRGQVGSGDAYSPGWFELPIARGAHAALVVTAEKDIDPASAASFPAPAKNPLQNSGVDRALLTAVSAFVVRRGAGKTVIAGYPWFLDWGRDTLICARGLLAAGMDEDLRQILITFARFEKDGTLPNTIHGADATNRDTTDAPLWFGLACEEMASATPHSDNSAIRNPQSAIFYPASVDPGGRSFKDVLTSIGENYIKGTPNGIRTDPDSALIWSPSHFTWMDTNYPAGTPREGYPVEIQALWIRLLRQLAAVTKDSKWTTLAASALASFEKLYWLEDRGYYADALLSVTGQPASQAQVSDALRSNALFPVSLGLVTGERARRCVGAVARYLVVPGALRSLAPLPVTLPLPVRGNDGNVINDPISPYWGRYEGDEDTRRKPAYHNGTAWTWTFPGFCEALARAWDFAPEAVAAARAYLGSGDVLLGRGCLGQFPEILDGDAPHTQRGCDAQAWGASEALRVWRLLEPDASAAKAP